MGPTKTSEEQTISSMNGHVQQDNQNDIKKLAVPKKVFVHRNSVLTDLMKVNHLQSVYNISVAVCSLLFLNAVIFYLADPSKFWQDMDVVRWGASKFNYFLIMWSLYHVFAFAIYEGFKLWINARNKIHAKIADGVFLLLYVTSVLFMFAATAYTILKIGFPPITGFSAAAEQVRIFMKIYSFVRENVPRVKQYKPNKDGNQVLYPPRSYFLYFLFIPAFVYRDSYPRTKKIHWDNLFYNLFKFFSVVFITYCVIMRFNVDMFKNVGIQQFNRREAALIAAGSMAAGAISMFMLFYGILHCWLNVFAELLTFGDREFYQDWWNSTSFSQYYRRWNAVVYDWLHAYIHTESQSFGCSRSVSMILVFLVSAFVHEYIICLALGFFYPALLAAYGTLGIFFVFLTKQRTTQFWNTFMWSMLFSGWGVLIFGYSSEWFARKNCPKEETLLDFFLPRTFDSSCHLINFS